MRSHRRNLVDCIRQTDARFGYAGFDDGRGGSGRTGQHPVKVLLLLRRVQVRKGCAALRLQLLLQVFVYCGVFATGALPCHLGDTHLVSQLQLPERIGTVEGFSELLIPDIQEMLDGRSQIATGILSLKLLRLFSRDELDRVVCVVVRPVDLLSRRQRPLFEGQVVADHRRTFSVPGKITQLIPELLGSCRPLLIALCDLNCPTLLHYGISDLVDQRVAAAEVSF